jgi:hypothetical protein
MVISNEENVFEALGNNWGENQCFPSCFRNDHFLPKKLEKPIFHKNFFHLFFGTTFENTLTIDDMPTRIVLIFLLMPSSLTSCTGPTITILI